MFFHSYDSELFCSACFNYWRFCDCIGDLYEDVGHPVVEGDGEGDDQEDPDEVMNLDWLWPDNAFPNIVTPPPLAGNKRPAEDPPQPVNLFGTALVTPPAKRPARLPGSTVAFSDPPPAADWRPVDNVADVPLVVNYDDNMDIIDGFDMLFDVPDIPNVNVSSGGLTKDESEKLVQDMQNGNDLGEELNNVQFNTPSLEDISRRGVPYSRLPNYAGNELGKDVRVPQFYGDYMTPDGSASVEYKTWYFQSFVPWYENLATPTHKLLLQNVYCAVLDPNKSAKIPGFQDIYVTEKKGGPNGVDTYHWTGLDGKQYEKKGGRPSVQLLPSIYLAISRC
jgi:hypothetical protein